MIEGYIVEPVRKKLAEDLAGDSRCFKNDCSLLDHVDRDTLVEMYHERAEFMEMRRYDDEPDDEELLYVMDGDFESFEDARDQEEVHQENRLRWPATIRRIFSKTNREMFSNRFGLDIWFSSVVLDDNGRLERASGVPQATVTYLTMPTSVTRRRNWTQSTGQNEDYYDTSRTVELSNGESGYGTAVEVGRQLSTEELHKFAKALNFLELEVFVHPSQDIYPALRLESPEEAVVTQAPGSPSGSRRSESVSSSDGADDVDHVDGSDDTDNTSTSPWPRLTLLTRVRD